ncbi:MAG: hypothetical protein OYL92_03250 [Acidobacteriota bacterium]|nr:hypothetical protein [Acidobacteriota bacterium]MDE2924314.1 hypothetical protein [Acidobacteriota bacterium]MDE3263964.1 hypothetical protein [Acidobacteriota bacterium]
MARNRTSLLVAVVVALIVPQAAQAYLDPASGSMILQAVIGGVAAAALAFKYYWRRILAFFGFGGTDESE